MSSTKDLNTKKQKLKKEGDNLQKDNKSQKIKPGNLNGTSMITSAIGFIISVIYLPQFSPNFAIAFAVVFLIIFLSSLFSVGRNVDLS